MADKLDIFKDTILSHWCKNNTLMVITHSATWSCLIQILYNKCCKQIKISLILSHICWCWGNSNLRPSSCVKLDLMIYHGCCLTALFSSHFPFSSLLWDIIKIQMPIVIKLQKRKKGNPCNPTTEQFNTKKKKTFAPVRWHTNLVHWS